ncbi:MAG: hypothetical protein IPK26_29515 [Planctomycetes bacterium]|nr:hypothetical protein [Planctomycetota bacterium]
MVTVPVVWRIGLVVVAAALPAQQVEFTTGRLADLSCRVTLATSPYAGTVLLEVEVRNQGGVTAEPTVFTCTTGIAGEVHRVERCPLPHGNRVGRGVGAGSQRTCYLQIETAAAPRSVKVELTSATFHRNAPLEDPPVLLGKLRQDAVVHGGLRHAATLVEIKSIVPEPVDVILRATYAEPDVSKGLLAIRLAPAEVREFAFSRRPLRLGFGDHPGTDGVKITALEVLDWTLVKDGASGPGAGAAGMAPFLQAYERWVRWTEPWPSGEGTFIATYLRSDRADGRADVIGGTFLLKDVAPPILDQQGNPDLKAREAVEAAVDAAFADLRRMSPAELQQRHQLSVADTARFLLEGPGWEGLFGKLCDVADGRIVRVAPADRATSAWQTWQLQPEGNGYLVVGRETFEVENGRTPIAVERRAYARQGRWLVPAHYRLETRRGSFREMVEVTFRCGPLRQRGEQPAGPPQGLGIDEVRKAWQNGYAWSKDPVPLRARFEIKTPGTDLIWQGEKRLIGSLHLGEFTGMRQDGTGWRSCTPVVEKKGIGPELQARLAQAIEDRLRLLAWRDFAGRLPFEVAFAGARMLPADGRAGTWTVTNCEFEEVEVKDGLIVRLRQAGGQDRRIDWQKLDGTMLPVRVTQGEAKVSITWKRVEGACFLPTDVRFEGLFGKQWGPETLRLSELSIRP